MCRHTRYNKSHFNIWQIFLKKTYSNPLSSGLNIDSEEAVRIHQRIIRENQLLTRHYEFVYAYFKKVEDSLCDLHFPSLEIGSGGGFLKEFIPDVITSDVVKSEGIDRIEDAASLLFPDRSLKAIYANGVLHHIKEPELCIKEIRRILVPGGMFVSNEPSTNFFGYFMNKYFNHEYTNKHVKEWKIDSQEEHGRLTLTNMAMPYIIFKRDAALFKQKFKDLEIISISYHDFLRYTLSGGLSYRPFVLRALYGTVNFIEKMFRPLMPVLGTNMLITVKKV